MRKLFHIGVESVHWNLINSLHSKAQTAVKWNNAISDGFPVKQGVRQGGIRSTDLFQVYENKMLDRLVASGLGTSTINCVTPTCADDLAISSERAATLQALVNIGVDYSILEKFLLHPTKSVIFSYLSARRWKCSVDEMVLDDMSWILEEQIWIKQSHIWNHSCTKKRNRLWTGMWGGRGGGVGWVGLG